MIENRKSSKLRRDLNDLVRDEQGKFSPPRVGLLIGQWLAIKIILGNETALIDNWDSLAIMFTVLIAPDMLKRVVLAKYSNGTTIETTSTAENVKTKQTTVTGKTTDESPRVLT